MSIAAPPEPNTVGLSPAGKVAVQRLIDGKIFLRQIDVYRFAIALGLAHGGYEGGIPKGDTMFNIGTLDPDGSLRTAVELLRGERDEPVLRSAERYAEWGVREMDRAYAGGSIRFSSWLAEAAESARERPEQG